MPSDSGSCTSERNIETDICIIGAGPAGIILAREFIGLPLHVSVLESGSFENDARTQELGCSKVESRPRFGSRAHRSIAALRTMRRGEWSTHALNHIAAIVRAPHDAAAIVAMRHRWYRHHRGGWSRPAVDRRRFGAIEVWAATEQTADRDNRITLSADRDRLGRNQVNLQWNWAASDRENVARSLRIFAERIERERLGRVVPWIEFEGAERPFFRGLHHPMGGTRMHPDPRQGVVDANCRVHGTENLFVAGSSVFSSGHGYANPTLTILALAVRLADHLKAGLA